MSVGNSSLAPFLRMAHSNTNPFRQKCDWLFDYLKLLNKETVL